MAPCHQLLRGASTGVPFIVVTDVVAAGGPGSAETLRRSARDGGRWASDVRVIGTRPRRRMTVPVKMDSKDTSTLFIENERSNRSGGEFFIWWR